MNTFDFTKKLTGRYRGCLQTSSPTHAKFSPLSTSPTRLVHLLQLMKLHRHIITTQSLGNSDCQKVFFFHFQLKFISVCNSYPWVLSLTLGTQVTHTCITSNIVLVYFIFPGQNLHLLVSRLKNSLFQLILKGPIPSFIPCLCLNVCLNLSVLF